MVVGIRKRGSSLRLVVRDAEVREVRKRAGDCGIAVIPNVVGNAGGGLPPVRKL